MWVGNDVQTQARVVFQKNKYLWLKWETNWLDTLAFHKTMSAMKGDCRENYSLYKSRGRGGNSYTVYSRRNALVYSGDEAQWGIQDQEHCYVPRGTHDVLEDSVMDTGRRGSWRVHTLLCVCPRCSNLPGCTDEEHSEYQQLEGKNRGSAIICTPGEEQKLRICKWDDCTPLRKSLSPPDGTSPDNVTGYSGMPASQPSTAWGHWVERLWVAVKSAPQVCILALFTD